MRIDSRRRQVYLYTSLRGKDGRPPGRRSAPRTVQATGARGVPDAGYWCVDGRRMAPLAAARTGDACEPDAAFMKDLAFIGKAAGRLVGLGTWTTHSRIGRGWANEVVRTL